MLKLDVRGVKAIPLEKEILTEGRVGLEISFSFSSDWDGLSKTAVFEGAKTIDVLLTENACVVPHECLSKSGPSLRVGVYGENNLGDKVTPTVWANFGQIQAAAIPSGEGGAIPTPTIVSQILTASAEALAASTEAVEIAQSVRDDADAGEFDGYSPSASVSKSGSTTTITITDKDGTTTAEVKDGAEDYSDLTNKPSINSVTLSGNKTTGDLGIKEPYWCTYGTTTIAEITAAYLAEKEMLVKIPAGDEIITARFLKKNSATKFSFVAVTKSGYVLTAVCDNDYWSYSSTRLAQYSELPHGVPPGGSSNQLLAKNSGSDYDLKWVNQSGGGGSSDVTWVAYGTSSFDDIDDAYSDDKLVAMAYDSRVYILHEANGEDVGGLTVITSYTFISFDKNGVLYWAICTMGNPDTWTHGSVTLYQFPSGGIPSSDMDSTVQTSLGKADSAYQKPNTGIPKTDLESAVQTSLGKADSALQSFTETDPTVPSWAKAANKPSYSASEVGAVAVAQGVGHAGEFVVVGSDGNITTVTMTAWQGGNY